MEKVFGNSEIYYMEPETLAALLRDPKEAAGVLVVDVRDSDLGPTMVAGTTVNVPARELTQAALERALDCYGTAPADYRAVVVHCMFSQQRGPRAAKLIDTFYPARHFSLYVLAGGFSTWRARYPDLLQPSKPFDGCC